MSEPHPEQVPGMEEPPRLKTAYEVVAEVVQANPGIESLTLVTYQEGPNWRDRAGADETPGLTSLLKGLQQDRGERVRAEVPRENVSAEYLRSFAQGLRSGRLLGVISKVRLTGGGSAHIPMMDFKCAPSAANLEVLTNLLRGFCAGRGYVLESGRSYHYYGLQLLTEDQWRVFLGKCILMSGYTDDRYIGHQLVDGHCVLRLSHGRLKSHIPAVAAELC